GRGLGGARLRVYLQRHRDAADAELVAVPERDRSGEPDAVDERPVLGAEVLQRRVPRGDEEACVPARDALRVDPDDGVGSAAEYVLPFAERDFPLAPQQAEEAVAPGRRAAVAPRGHGVSGEGVPVTVDRADEFGGAGAVADRVP